MSKTIKQSRATIAPESIWARKKSYALALAIASVTVSQVYAQDEASQDEPSSDSVMEEIVVTGMRQSLQTAQDLKRDSATVIDSITAEDLGSFPDKSIAEALQRVAGITVNRFAASSDTAHFSAEPSGVIVRGLTQVRTEFNGRDSFSANSSRGLSWGDVSPELMAGVDTYKNQMAELIEGGIAGTVNMRTRLPFDQDGQMFAATLSTNYGNLSDEYTPEGSALYSNRWDVASGEFGILANIAYSNVQTKSEGNQLYRMNRFRNVFGDSDQDGVVDQDVNGDGVVDERDTLTYIPAAIYMRDNTYERTRLGGSIAVQWQNADETFVVTGQYNRSQYENTWEEYVVGVSPADLSFGQSVFYELQPYSGDPQSNTLPQPAPGTDEFTFDQNGLFQTGTTNTGVGWWGGDDAEAAARGQAGVGEPFVIPCYNNGNNSWDGVNACSPSIRGMDTTSTTRAASNENVTQDFSVNIQWSISDSVRSNFDVQFVDSEVDNYDAEMSFQTYTNPFIDLTGERPRLELSAPTNVNWSAEGLTDPHNYFLKHISDHLEDSEGEQFAARADFEFDIDKGPLASIKVGTRYAKRDQVVRWGSYNWQSVATPWGDNQAHYFNIDQHDPTPGGTNGVQPNFTGYPEGYYALRTFGTSYHDINMREFYFADADLIADRIAFADAFSAGNLGFEDSAGNPSGDVVGWDAICSNTGDRSEEVPGTCFTPPEIADVSEETMAAYVQLNFGGSDAEIFGIPFSGNLGVRWVKTTNTGNGGISVPDLDANLFFDPEYKQIEDDPETPDFVESGETLDRTTLLPKTPENLTCTYIPDSPPTPANPAGTPPPVPNTLGCYLSEDDVAFLNGEDQLNVVETSNTKVLPSFNLKLEFTEELQARLAISRAMSRPDIGNLRNYVGISGDMPDESSPNDPGWVRDSSGEIVGLNVFYNAGGQNPYLKPIIADQIDLTLEYYFSDVGSFTAAVFQKKFDDYIQAGRYNRYITSGGVTRAVEIVGPVNADGAKMNGFELAYQTFFDSLPEPFNGLGIQANYTYVNNDGISNSNVQSVVGDQGEASDTGQATDSVEVNRLESLSDQSYTFIGMYEKGDWSARLAYSWRDDYLVTAVDCCVALPVWQKAYGQLDGSIKYTISDSLTVSLSGSNLLGEETVTEQQVENWQDGGLRLPTGRFRNDTRYTLTLTYQL